MKQSPLRDRLTGVLILALRSAGAVELRRQPAENLIDELMQAVADATPAEIVEEGGYLLGASHLWSDTQGTKATEHMVRRITAADQIVRTRLQREINLLTDLLAEVEWTCEDPDSKSCPLFCPRCGGLKKADKEREVPAGHAIGCQLANAIARNT